MDFKTLMEKGFNSRLSAISCTGEWHTYCHTTIPRKAVLLLPPKRKYKNSRFFSCFLFTLETADNFSIERNKREHSHQFSSMQGKEPSQDGPGSGVSSTLKRKREVAAEQQQDTEVPLKDSTEPTTKNRTQGKEESLSLQSSAAEDDELTDGEADGDAAADCDAASAVEQIDADSSDQRPDNEISGVSYTDFSQEVEVDSAAGSCSTRESVQTFPMKLHSILSKSEFAEIICWLPHGRAWRILQHRAFEEIVIPLYFRHGRYSSFARQVNGWGFTRIASGPDYNAYYHELFLRGKFFLCERMKRLTGKETQNKPKAPDGSDVPVPTPDFYELAKQFPLPEQQELKPEEKTRGMLSKSGSHASLARRTSTASSKTSRPSSQSRPDDISTSSRLTPQPSPLVQTSILNSQRELGALLGNVQRQHQLDSLIQQQQQQQSQQQLLALENQRQQATVAATLLGTNNGLASLQNALSASSATPAATGTGIQPTEAIRRLGDIATAQQHLSSSIQELQQSLRLSSLPSNSNIPLITQLVSDEQKRIQEQQSSVQQSLIQHLHADQQSPPAQAAPMAAVPTLPLSNVSTVQLLAQLQQQQQSLGQQQQTRTPTTSLVSTQQQPPVSDGEDIASLLQRIQQRQSSTTAVAQPGSESPILSPIVAQLLLQQRQQEAAQQQVSMQQALNTPATSPLFTELRRQQQQQPSTVGSTTTIGVQGSIPATDNANMAGILDLFRLQQQQQQQLHHPDQAASFAVAPSAASGGSNSGTGLR